MNVVRASVARSFELPGLRFTSLASPTTNGSETCLWQLDVDAGLDSGQAHSLDRDEVFVVLDGRVRLQPGGPELAAGDAAVVPAGEPIQLSNAGDGAARLHVAIRAGFVATMADGTAIGTPPWAA